VDLTFRLLGALRVEGAPVALGPRPERAILAMLLLQPGRVLPVDRLVAQLWGDQPPADATAAVHGHVADLRRALEPGGVRRVLLTSNAGYLIDVAPERTDIGRFTAAARAGRQALRAGDAAAAASRLEAALAEWQGAPLAEFAGEPFAGPAIAHLENLHADAVQDRAEARLLLGDAGWCVTELGRLVHDMPYRERLWELYAAALYRSGQPADALDALRRMRNMMDDEMGLAPGPGIGALEQAILRHDEAAIPSGGAGATPAP
jgi:DNA-binding SARP family transcriptional activator